MYSYTAPQSNGDGPMLGGGALSADDFSEPTANGTYQSMATGVRCNGHLKIKMLEGETCRFLLILRKQVITGLFLLMKNSHLTSTYTHQQST